MSAGLHVRRNEGERVFILDSKGKQIGVITCRSSHLRMDMEFDKEYRIHREEVLPEKKDHVQE